MIGCWAMKSATQILAAVALALWALWLTYNAYQARIYSEKACALAARSREWSRQAAWLHDLPLPSGPVVPVQYIDHGPLYGCFLEKTQTR